MGLWVQSRRGGWGRGRFVGTSDGKGKGMSGGRRGDDALGGALLFVSASCGKGPIWILDRLTEDM